MKRIILLAAVALFSLNVAQAQEQQMKLGGSLSFPTGDLGNVSNFGLQADFAYLFNVEGNLQAGPMASLFYYFGSDNFDDVVFLPIGGTARYNINDFFVGVDLGYGIGIAPSGNDGGFFYRPKVGYHIPNQNFGIIVSYSGVSVSGATASAVNLGVEFDL